MANIAHLFYESFKYAKVLFHFSITLTYMVECFVYNEIRFTGTCIIAVISSPLI